MIQLSQANTAAERVIAELTTVVNKPIHRSVITIEDDAIYIELVFDKLLDIYPKSVLQCPLHTQITHCGWSLHNNELGFTVVNRQLSKNQIERFNGVVTVGCNKEVVNNG